MPCCVINPQSQRAFTFVELVVVVLLLGLLAVALLPRFTLMTEQAERAVLEGLAGNLRSGISLFHAAWQLEGRRDGASIDLSGYGLGTLDANRFGYPAAGRRDVGTTGRDRDCEDVWVGLLNPAPTIIEADPNKEAGSSANHIEPRLGTGIEFVAGQDANIPDATIPLPFANNAEVCQFISLAAQSVAPGTPKPTIFYDTRTGQVLLDMDRVF